MSLITIIIIFFCIGKLLDHMKLKAQQKQLERVKAEQKRSREWQRANEAWQKAQEREDARIAREVERVAKEQARQADQIAKLTFKASEAERTIEHYTPLYETLKRQYDELYAKVSYYESKNLMCGGMKKDLARVGDKLFSIETKLRKAEFDKEFAESKLSA